MHISTWIERLKSGQTDCPGDESQDCQSKYVMELVNLSIYTLHGVGSNSRYLLVN